MKRRSFLQILGISAMVRADVPGSFTLVEKGAMANAIFLPENAAPPVALAANELQHYIEKISGARLPIQSSNGGAANLLRIGATAAATPALEPPSSESDAFRIKVTPQGIALAGANPRSTLYAAYDLLEQLGCRWYSPMEDGEYVPSASTITLPSMDKASEAAFASRGMVEDARQGIGDAFWEKRIAQDAITFGAWMTRNRMNAYRNTSTLDPGEFDRRGMTTRWGSSHSIPRMLDKKLFATQPELFRMDQGGKRVPDGNVCVTNAETVRLCAQVVMDFFAKNPQADSYPVVGQDIWGGAWCSCEKCRGYSPSEQNAVLINGIQEILRASGVKGRCSYSAYRDTLRYDLKKVKLDREVRVGYAPRERSYGHALSDPSSERNRWFWRNLQNWRRNHSGPIGVSDYYHDCILFYSLPASTVSVIAQDLRDYAGLNARGVTSFMMGRYSWYAYAPSFYVFAKMAWDPSLDPDTLLDEMAQRLYGPAAGSIRSFWREFEAGMRPFIAQGEFETLPATADPFVEQMLLDFDEGIAHLGKAQGHVNRALLEAADEPYTTRVRLQQGIGRLSRAGAEALRHTLQGNYWTAVARRDDVFNATGLTHTPVRGIGYARQHLTAARDAWQKVIDIAHEIDPKPGSYWVRNPNGGGLKVMNGAAIAVLDHQLRELDEIAKRNV